MIVDPQPLLPMDMPIVYDPSRPPPPPPLFPLSKGKQLVYDMLAANVPEGRPTFVEHIRILKFTRKEVVAYVRVFDGEIEEFISKKISFPGGKTFNPGTQWLFRRGTGEPGFTWDDDDKEWYRLDKDNDMDCHLQCGSCSGEGWRKPPGEHPRNKMIICTVCDGTAAQPRWHPATRCDNNDEIIY
jgi:hypothetical protein